MDEEPPKVKAFQTVMGAKERMRARDDARTRFERVFANIEKWPAGMDESYDVNLSQARHAVDMYTRFVDLLDVTVPNDFDKRVVSEYAFKVSVLVIRHVVLPFDMAAEQAMAPVERRIEGLHFDERLFTGFSTGTVVRTEPASELADIKDTLTEFEAVLNGVLKEGQDVSAGPRSLIKAVSLLLGKVRAFLR
jgi:hypothetical protein